MLRMLNQTTITELYFMIKKPKNPSLMYSDNPINTAQLQADFYITEKPPAGYSRRR
jgi:hypothetical protein